MGDRALSPETQLALKATLWLCAEPQELTGVTRALSAVDRADALPADYFELYHLLRALAMAPEWARAEYRALVKAALRRAPQEARRAASRGADAPWWLKD